jgi:hypothetical protein
VTVRHQPDRVRHRRNAGVEGVGEFLRKRRPFDREAHLGVDPRRPLVEVERADEELRRGPLEREPAVDDVVDDGGIAHRRAHCDQVEVGENRAAARAEAFVADVAAADDGRRVVGGERLVAHPVVHAREVDQEVEHTGAAQGDRIMEAHLDVHNCSWPHIQHRERPLLRRPMDRCRSSLADGTCCPIAVVRAATE